MHEHLADLYAIQNQFSLSNAVVVWLLALLPPAWMLLRRSSPPTIPSVLPIRSEP